MHKFVFILLIFIAPITAFAGNDGEKNEVSQINMGNLLDEPVKQPQRLTASAEKDEPAGKLTVSQKATLKRLEKYLASIKTISAHFSQISPDGGLSNGTFYLQRPGKLRMEYEPPVPVLVVTSGGEMIYYDKELDQVTHVPLDSTLVGFLARDRIAFDKSVEVTLLEEGQQSVRVSLIEAGRSGDGVMTLEFSDAPLQLRNIVIVDSGQQSTTVSLSDARFDEPLKQELFVFHDPHPMGGRSIKK